MTFPLFGDSAVQAHTSPDPAIRVPSGVQQTAGVVLAETKAV